MFDFLEDLFDRRRHPRRRRGLFGWLRDLTRPSYRPYHDDDDDHHYRRPAPARSRYRYERRRSRDDWDDD